jgi:hypothetical protein
VSYPPFVNYATEAEYKAHYERVYCQGPVICFDGIAVRFRKDKFRHAFFESSRGNKDDIFSTQRAQRIDWIKTALEDPTSERYVGWDNVMKKYDKGRRVVVTPDDYVVVISIIGEKKGEFVTAYLADTPGQNGRSSTIEKIRRSPSWA